MSDKPVQSTTLQPSGHSGDAPLAGRWGTEADISPVGAKRAFTAQVRALVETAGDDVRTEFAAPSTVQLYVSAIRRGLEAGDRTALNLYSQVMKLVGEERRITVEFIHGLGAKSEEELRRYVDAAKSVEGAGPHDGAERCVAYLEAYLNVYPEQRSAALRRLGGYSPAGEVYAAEVG